MSMELRHAILGLLSIRPLSGYDLGTAFAGSVSHFWHADRSQIYRTLERMAEQGLIETERIAQETRPDRKVHSLTASGRAVLHDWLASPLDPERPKEPFLARLFFAAELDGEGWRRLLDERELAVRSGLDELRRIDVVDDDLAHALRSATLRYGLAAAEAELAWIDETRTRLDALASPGGTGGGAS